MSFEKTIIITGGAGFIGSHVVRLFVKKYPKYRIINLDALTYAGNLENVQEVSGEPNYRFVKANIFDRKALDKVFEEIMPDAVIHLAAESHVDRSISNPADFVETNVMGTLHLLQAAQAHWKNKLDGKCFYHISTDEVFGSLGASGLFSETTAYDPRSPYSASKAASDHLVRAYYHTFNLPVVLSNCSNNYGPYHFPEKLIPLCINNIIHNKPLPIYGDGLYTRDWLYVEDHAAAIDTVFHHGKKGESYNVGGWNEWTNIDLVKLLCKIGDELLDRSPGSSEKLISYVTNRPGHDRRYAIDATKIKKELGWTPQHSFDEGIQKTFLWYLNNPGWLSRIISGEYQSHHYQH